MTFYATKRAKKSLRGTIWISSSLGLLILIVIAWSVFWRIEADATLQTLNAWMDQEAKAGYNWTCPEKKLSGYPFGIEISCAQPQFDGVISGKTLHGDLAGFSGFASLLQPDKVTALFQAPFTAKSEAEDFSFRLDWSSLELTLAGNPASLQNCIIEARDLILEGTFADLGALAGKAGNLTVRFSRVAEGSSHAYGFDLNLTNGTSPQIERLLASALPADLKLAGSITGIDFGGGGDAIEKIEDWRMSGGKLDFGTAEFVQAQLKLAAKGQLGLDAEHRIEGKLDTYLTGFAPILRKFGINPVLLDAASLIGALTGKSTGGEARSLRVPLSFANGVLSIGPLRTPVALQPLY